MTWGRALHKFLSILKYQGNYLGYYNLLKGNHIKFRIVKYSFHEFLNHNRL